MAESTIFEVAAPGYGLRFPNENVVDCNSILTDNATELPGLYRYSTDALNRPNDGTGGILNSQNGGYGAQLGVKDGTNELWIRNSTPSNGWGNWEQVITNSLLKSINNDKGARFVSVAGSATSVASSTSSGTALASIKLPAPGIWMILACAKFATNANGYRGLCLHSTSGKIGDNLFATNYAAAFAGQNTFIYLPIVIERTTASTTFYLNAIQNSGSALSTTGAIRAFNLYL